MLWVTNQIKEACNTQQLKLSSHEKHSSFLVPSSRLLRHSGYVGFGCLTCLFDLVVLVDESGVSGIVV